MKFDPIEVQHYFRKTFRDEGFFSGWRQRGSKRFFFERENHVLSVRLEEMKHSSLRKRLISLSLVLRVPSEIEPAFCRYGRGRKEGELMYAWSVRKDKGIGLPSVDSLRVWEISTEEHLEEFKEELKDSISKDLRGYVIQYQTLNDFSPNRYAVFRPLLATLASWVLTCV